MACCLPSYFVAGELKEEADVGPARQQCVLLSKEPIGVKVLLEGGKRLDIQHFVTGVSQDAEETRRGITQVFRPELVQGIRYLLAAFCCHCASLITSHVINSKSDASLA